MANIFLFGLLALVISCSTLEPVNEGKIIDARPVDGVSISQALANAELEEKNLGLLENHAQIVNEENEAVAANVADAPTYVYELIPANHNRLTKKWIEYYSVKDRERFQRFLNNGQVYKTVIQQLLVDHGLPPDLYFLGILESGYKTHAVSHAGAVGPWQFMRPTGKEYGLAIDYYVDERLDPMRSTVAAIRYLKELYRQFRSWELALSAYNAGPGRVRRAIRRGGTKDYWNLSNRRYLPRDTRHYVPQFLAILTIGTNPEKYGFHLNQANKLPPIRLVNVPSPVKLQDISNMCKVSLTRLKKMNPHLTRGLTPPHLKSYDIWVPQSHVVKVIAKKPHLKDKIVKGLKRRNYVAKRGKARYHRVKRGQTLSTIARHYGKSIKYIKSLNRLSNNRIYVGQKLKVSGTAQVVKKHRVASKSIRYKIRRGDSLIGIARKFNTTVSKIKETNSLRGNHIQKGQYLVIADNRN